MTDSYVMFDKKFKINKEVKLKPDRKINSSVKGNLKVSLYNIMGKILDIFAKLSADTK